MEVYRNHCTEIETLTLRSRDQDRDLSKMNSSALESRDLDLAITTLSQIQARGLTQLY